MVKELLSQLNLGSELTSFIIILSLGTIAATVLISLLFRKPGIVKFLPGTVMILIGIFKFLSISLDLLDSRNLGGIMTVLLLGALGFVSVCTAAIMQIVMPKRRKRRAS